MDHDDLARGGEESPEVIDRIYALADAASAAVRRNPDYWTSPQTKPLRQEVERFKVESGLSPQRFAEVWAQAWSRATLDEPDPEEKKENLTGWIVGVGGVAAVVVVVAMLLVAFFPASTLWMNKLVCSSPYGLEYEVDNSHSTSRSMSDVSFTNVSFRCVWGDKFQAVSEWLVIGLQGLLVALVVVPVAVLGIVLWRRSRSPLG